MTRRSVPSSNALVRRRRACLVIVLAAALAGSGLLGGADTARAQVGAPGELPPLRVELGPAGPVPVAITAAVGQSVVFANASGVTRSIAATDGTFTSGPIPAGGRFVVALGARGCMAVCGRDRSGVCRPAHGRRTRARRRTRPPGLERDPRRHAGRSRARRRTSRTLGRRNAESRARAVHAHGHGRAGERGTRRRRASRSSVAGRAS